MTSHETYEKMSAAMRNVNRELLLESDRGCVVLAFAWIDEEMAKVLQRYLIPSKKPSLKSDELLGVGQPLGDASSRIDLSLRLGLIHPSVHQSLHLLRKLRNDFAHLSSNLTFETPSIHDRVLAIFDNEEDILNAMWQATVTDSEARRVTEEHRGLSGARILRQALGAKRLFCLTAAGLLATLISIGDRLKPATAPNYPIGEA